MHGAGARLLALPQAGPWCERKRVPVAVTVGAEVAGGRPAGRWACSPAGHPTSREEGVKVLVAFRPRQPWPPVAERRRAVVNTRTASGEECTIIVERQVDGPLIVSFHGAMRTTAAPDPTELDELVAALQAAGAR